MYHCETNSVRGFVQQLAVGYVAHGYWFYVHGFIPAHKDPHLTDAKIIDQYGIDMSKWTRSRRKKLGLANLQYLRHGRFWVVLATHGQHPFFAAEAGQIRDIRDSPLHFAGYAIGCRRGRNDSAYHASVRIERERFRELKRDYAARAVHEGAEDLVRRLRSIGFEPYAPVRGQVWQIWREVNRRRKAAGLELVPSEALYRRRFPVKPFA